ncbi:MAG TPA: Hsp20/alpha crystallin family protein [Methanoregula sp.]|nr:Hsp20/alpha crystallin family protein [Methanoregula sp.]
MTIDNKDLINAINGLVDRLMAEMGENSPNLQPHVVGYRIVIDGVPVAPGAPGSNFTGGSDEPVPEVTRIGDEICVVADLPGVTEETLKITLDGTTLTIDGNNTQRPYHATATLPPADPATMKHALKHGVLQVTLQALPEAPESSTTEQPEETN